MLGTLSGNGMKRMEENYDDEKQSCTLFSYSLRHKELLTHSTITKKWAVLE